MFGSPAYQDLRLLSRKRCRLGRNQFLCGLRNGLGLRLRLLLRALHVIFAHLRLEHTNRCAKAHAFRGRLRDAKGSSEFRALQLREWNVKVASREHCILEIAKVEIAPRRAEHLSVRQQLLNLGRQSRLSLETLLRSSPTDRKNDRNGCVHFGGLPV